MKPALIVILFALASLGRAIEAPPEEDPTVSSVAKVWRGAEWHERECYDLFGVTFIGNSDLRRIMLPDDWVGHPLRKDFVEPEEYHGISTRRESLLKL